MGRTTRRRVTGALTAVVIALGGLGACSDDDGSKKDSSKDGATAGANVASGSAAPSNALANDLQAKYQEVVRNVLPSVVQITTQTGLGSGVVYDDKGNIVTNAHVVGQATTFEVTLPNASKPVTAKLVAAFAPDDLAVIRLDNPPGDLKPARFADSAKLQVGQITMAMGNPLGLDSSVTEGIVSAVGRTVSEPQSTGSTGATISSAIQTSAAINPGNSGGALVDLDSQVIGIPTLAATDPETNGGAAPGIGFAIPANTVKSIADQIIRNGKVDNSGKAALGVTVRTVAGSNGRASGVGVVSVQEGGAAQAAGIRQGDVITSIDDQPITDVASLSEALGGKRPGDKATVSLVRAGNGSQATVEATLGELES
ncbi:trypsin-like peptidase domain-containing protein [Embleya sp. NBC_00888]|uniref:S1C family serine protease n=1 Tax=Embleya sp. NBC_00888 TaxID=2975960 RepID=UPI00386701E3|nr:trypsin-like peptidase domain-containing protein [Embleya sp. NBC_00888]